MTPTDNGHTAPKRVMSDVARPTKAASPPTQSATTKAKPRKRLNLKKPKLQGRVGIYAVAAVIIGLLAAGGVLYVRYQDAKKEVARLSNPEELAKAEQNELVRKVSALVELPEGEEPIFATVSDVSKLKSQAFFTNAQNGDKALIYTKAKKAFLYRPSTNKIIEIGPINLGSEAQTTQAAQPAQ